MVEVQDLTEAGKDKAWDLYCHELGLKILYQPRKTVFLIKVLRELAEDG